MPATVSRAIAGFIAGALAVLVFHQGMYFVMKMAGLPLQGVPWNMKPLNAANPVPILLNQMFWGGLWGVLFAFVYHALPTKPAWSKGFIFGLMFPMLLGSWVIVAGIKGQPMFADLGSDWNPMRLRNGFLLNGLALGVGLGVLYPLLARMLSRRAR
jgi:hypothetical protein